MGVVRTANNARTPSQGRHGSTPELAIETYTFFYKKNTSGCVALMCADLWLLAGCIIWFKKGQGGSSVCGCVFVGGECVHHDFLAWVISGSKAFVLTCTGDANIIIIINLEQS